MATIQAKNNWNFTDDDITALRDLAAGLEPLELAIKKLGSKGNSITILSVLYSLRNGQLLINLSLGMNLIGAECVYEYCLDMFKKLNSSIARKLEQKFLRRLGERRHPKLVHLILFLKNPSYWDKEKDFLGFRIQKRKMKTLATDFVKRLFPEDVTQNSSMEFAHDQDGDMTFFEPSESNESPALTNAETLEVRLDEIL